MFAAFFLTRSLPFAKCFSAEESTLSKRLLTAESELPSQDVMAVIRVEKKNCSRGSRQLCHFGLRASVQKSKKNAS
jgi:hypothetical protein